MAELLAEAFVSWCAEGSISLRYIQSGKPELNAFIERFRRTYRTVVLDASVFEPLEQVWEISAQWLISYNEQRLHEALAGLPPPTYRPQITAETSPFGVSP